MAGVLAVLRQRRQGNGSIAAGAAVATALQQLPAWQRGRQFGRSFRIVRIPMNVVIVTYISANP